jgi:hypothetical protein
MSIPHVQQSKFRAAAVKVLYIYTGHGLWQLGQSSDHQETEREEWVFANHLAHPTVLEGIRKIQRQLNPLGRIKYVTDEPVEDEMEVVVRDGRD